MSGYAAASLDALPYRLIPHANVLLAGASGGFRVAEVLALGAAHIRVLEPEPVLLRALERGLGPSPAWASDGRVSLSGEGPVAAVRDSGSYDIIDLSADFLDAAEANATAFTVQALSDDLRTLAPGGIVSIPVSIRDFPVYALRVLATARAALLAAGIGDPAAHTVVYRSAWSARIMLSNRPWSAERIATLRTFCDERSFDVSWYPGMDAVAARESIYNDLPAVSFASGETSADGPDDSIADEARAVLADAATPSRSAFNLAPITLDRPFFNAVLRLDQLDTILKRLEILPQAEIGALVNLAVLAQAVVFAMLVLLVPLAAPRRLRMPEIGLLRPIVYFPALGLGFLFIEIFMIEQASQWLNDRTSGFALVLTGMLVFSGLGSMMADRLTAAPRRAIALVCLVTVGWCGAMLVGLQPIKLATLGLPWMVRASLVLAVVAPVSVALGLPFPLGLARTGSGGLLPWAWGLNGAFSVVATPLANLIAREAGFSRVLLSAAVLYVIALLTFPAARKSRAWQKFSVRITRRGVISAAGALCLAHPTRAASPWTRTAYMTAMNASGRPVSLTDAQFDAIQKRKPAVVKHIEAYLKERLGAADPAVIAAFETVPREYFHYIYSEHRATPGDAYEADPKPWGLGYGSALSDYLGQAYMTQVCKPEPGEVTLEIGTGSGFQSALLSRIVKQAYSIEIIEPLGKAVSQIFAPLGYDNVHTRVGDGYYGWPEVHGGFDIIIVTCAAQYAPPDLFKQMKPGGRLVIPIGQPFKRGQVLYVYTKDGEGKIHSKRDMGVFFIPMTGAISKTPAPHAAAAAQAVPTEKPASD